MPTYELLVAYCRTDYLVTAPDRQLLIRPGCANSSVDEVLAADGSFSWIIVTADNPQSNQFTDTENALRREQLAAYLKCSRGRVLPSTARARDSSWPEERGFFVTDASVSEGLRMAAAFGQHAIVYGTTGRPATLRFTRPEIWKPVVLEGLTGADEAVRTICRDVCEAQF